MPDEKKPATPPPPPPAPPKTPLHPIKDAQGNPVNRSEKPPVEKKK